MSAADLSEHRCPIARGLRTVAESLTLHSSAEACIRGAEELERLRAERGKPVAWLYEVFIGDGAWSQKYSDTEILPTSWIRNIRALYLAPPADEVVDLKAANETLHGLVTNREAEIERLKAELDEAKERAHLAEGTKDLAIKHRNAAEAESERLKAERAEEWRLKREAQADRDVNAAVIVTLKDELREAREVWEEIEREAERYAEMYEPASDARNTFIIFGDMVRSKRRALKSADAVNHGQEVIEQRCTECGCERPELGWYSVGYDDLDKLKPTPITFFCLPECAVAFDRRTRVYQDDGGGKRGRDYFIAEAIAEATDASKGAW